MNSKCLETAEAKMGARPSTLAIEPLRLVARAAIIGPPVRVGVGSENVRPPLHHMSALPWHCSSLYACGEQCEREAGAVRRKSEKVSWG